MQARVHQRIARDLCLCLLLAAAVATTTAGADQPPARYEPTWQSLDRHPVAPWWRDAKFGVYVHWTLASVPAWGNHASFYWPNLLKSRGLEAGGPRPAKNAIEDEYIGLWDFHRRTYGPDFQFPGFAPLFKAEAFDPERWAEIFARSGARYVVLTAKHHDGFCLWPSAEASRNWGRPWTAFDMGPRRDLVGDLSAAVRRRGLKMGLYYSLFEWYNPLWLSDRAGYVSRHMQPQLRDLVVRYKPDVLWGDGEWDASDEFWNSRGFLTWLFNDSPVPQVVIDDRWGRGSRHRHGGFYTTEFAAGMADGRHPWEENRTMTRPRAWDSQGRPLWYDWVHNRQLTLENYYSPRELILTLADTVSRGGNLLLNTGPTADGRIPVIEEERLAQIGDWLKVNGEAIYSTHPWRHSCQWSAGRKPDVPYNEEWRVKYDVEALTGPGGGTTAIVEAFFTAKGDAVYAIVPRWPAGPLVIHDLHAGIGAAVTMLGVPGVLPWKSAGTDVVVNPPQLAADALPCQYAFVIKLAAFD